MSNIDKHALREAALEADEALQIMKSDIEVNPGHVDSINAFYSMLSPDTVLALLDELEAKDNRINRLEAIVAVAEKRNALMREWKRALKVPCDLVDDQVPVVIHGMVIRLERLKETEEKLETAEKRIAELEARQPYGYLRQNDGRIQISIGSNRPHDRSGGFATPWFAIYTAAAGKGEAS